MRALLLLLLLVPHLAFADGGAILTRQTINDLDVTVFAAPLPLRAGPVDVSVLVQDAKTTKPLLDAQVDQGGDHWAAGLYGRLEAAGQMPVPRPFATLNTLAARDGVLIRVTGKPAKPIHIIHRRASDSADVIWHHVIRMEPGSELTLLETGMTGARSNGVIEAEVARGARLRRAAARSRRSLAGASR